MRTWQLAAAGVALLAVAGVQVARHGLPDVVHGSGHAVIAVKPASPPKIDRQATLSSIVGSRCPTSVVCGVSATVPAGMSAEFRKNFPDATVSLAASAFDAGSPKTYWQQIGATTPAGTSIVVSEQRIRVAIPGPHRLTVNRSPDGATVTVSDARGAWLVMANLTGASASAIPVAAARRWVLATPLPR